MQLTELSFKQNRVVLFFIIALVLGGIGSYMMMSKLEDPEINLKMALIVTPYPGASALEVEQAVTDLLESEIKSMGDIERIRSRSLPNMSEIEVMLRNTIKDEDITQYWDVLRKKINDVSHKLPQDAMTPMVFDDFGDVYGLFYALTSDGFSYEEMSEYAKEIKKRLISIKGVRRVNINGEQNTVIYIDIEEDKLASLGIHPAQIILAINNQSNSVYAGNYETSDKIVRISVNNKMSSVESIENITIKSIGNSQVKLKDLARIRRDTEENSGMKMKYNQRQAIGISISMESGENIIKIGEKVAKIVDEYSSQLPIGIEFEKVYFQSEEVSKAIDEFILNLILSLLIVIIIIMLVMGFKAGSIIGISLLITIVGTFPFLYLLDGTIQRVSLASFIIAMGMLVDNGIVVVDGIWEDLKKGQFRRKAIFATPKRAAWPLLGATLIAIFSFLPVFLSPDNTGTYTRDLFLVLSISLLLSWILAMTQVPLMVYYMLSPQKHNKNKNNKNSQNNKFFIAMRYIIEWSLRHKIIVVVSVSILLGISVYLFRFVNKSFFPEFTYSQAYLEYKLPAGTSQSKVENDLDAISEWLKQKQEVKSITLNTGGTPTRYNLTRIMAERNPSYGELIIEFSSYEDRVAMKPIIETYVREQYPDAYVRLKNYSIIFSENAVEVQFEGNDLETLKQLSAKAEAIMKKSPIVDNATIRNNLQSPMPYLHIDYRIADGIRAGVERRDIGYTMMAATTGFPIAKYYENDRELPIMLKIQQAGNNVQNIENLPLWGLNSINIPIQKILNREIPLDKIEEELLKSQSLSSVANISLEWEEPIIRRFNNKRMIKAQCDPIVGYTADDILKSIKSDIDNIELPLGYSYKWGGERGDQAQALKYIVIFLPVAIFLIMLMLLLLFKSFRKTTIMFLCIILAIIGIVPALILTGREFGFIAIVGSIGMMGMMIKNGVVLIDEIDRLLKLTGKLYHSLVEASLSRVRPVFMASLTTILGMFPLVFDPFFGSIAVTIMGGLLVGTLIIIVIVPVLYAFMFEKKKKLKKVQILQN